MRLFVFFALLAAPAFAQYDASTLQGKQPCTATRTTNCITRVDTAGRMTASTTLPTNAEYNNGTCTTAKTITPVNGNRQKVTLTNAQTCALTFTQPSSGTVSIQLKVIQSASGSFNGAISTTACASNGTCWPGGSTPTITATTGAEDVLSCYLDGTKTYCVATQDFR